MDFNTLKSLGGYLHCQLTSNHGNRSNVTEVDIHQSLIVTCSSSQMNRSNFTFKWLKNGHLVRTRRESILNISHVSWNHAANFTCTIKKQEQILESCSIIVAVKSMSFLCFNMSISSHLCFPSPMSIPPHILHNISDQLSFISSFHLSISFQPCFPHLLFNVYHLTFSDLFIP